MKIYKLIGLTISMSLTTAGYISFIISVLTETNLRFNYWWLVGVVGMLLFMIFLLLMLLSIFRKRTPRAMVYGWTYSSASRQIVLSIINIVLGLGFGILSTITALYALVNAVNAKNEANNSHAKILLKTSRSLNIVSVVFVTVQWVAVIYFILSFEKV